MSSNEAHEFSNTRQALCILHRLSWDVQVGYGGSGIGIKELNEVRGDVRESYVEVFDPRQKLGIRN